MGISNKINNLEPVSLPREEQIRLASLYKKTKDSNTLALLVRANVRLAAKMAHKYKRAGIEVEDLISEGIGGIIYSLNLYDPDKGASFTSFAALWIRARIQEHVQNNCTTIRVGTRTAKQLFASLPRLKREYGENLTTDIIASELKLKPKDVASTIAYLSKRTLDLNHRVTSDSRALSEVIGDPELSIEDKAIERERSARIQRLCKDFILTLNERDSYIYQNRILCILEDCNRTPAAILSEKLGVTKQRISQIEKSLKNKLALYLKTSDIFG
jgi:RNA polymerase sigma-32 factor